MPAFEYIALDADGRQKKGVLEADTARQGIQALGVPPALIHLAPATFSDSLRLEPRREESGKRITGKDWITTLAVLGGLLGFGFVLIRLFGGRGF